ncbi:hypothetical protein [Tahibacter caeni]|uniref:hypothetical protein n=1 Tax=Tahibacter caeni TaxID=1453545 RepID=UPI00214935D1|nr:hypothetical protein [Tahibacter caeni]
MKSNFAMEKRKRLLRWVRLQWNKPPSGRAVWRENRAGAAEKPARMPGNRSRRGTRAS